MASTPETASAPVAPALNDGPVLMGVRMGTRRACLLLAFFAYSLAASLHWGWLREYSILDLPPRWDEAAYHTRAVWFAESLRSRDFAGFWTAFADPGEPRPPLLSLSTLPVSVLGPYEVWYGHAVILAYLGLLVVSVYFIGEHLGGPLSGLFADLYLLAFPSTLVYSRVFLSDLPVAALVSLMLLCLLKSAHFTKVGWNVALGGVLGLAMNMRNFAGVYVFLPLLYSFYRGSRAVGLAKTSAKLLPGVIIALALMAPWYLTHIDALMAFISMYTYGDLATVHAGEGTADSFSAVGTQPPPIYYFKVLMFSGPSVFFGIPLALLVCMTTARLRALQAPASAGGMTLLLWTLGSFATLSSISNISHNYAMPVLPAIALSIEYLAARLRVTRAIHLYAAIPIIAISIPYFTQPVGIEWGDTIRRFYPNAAKGTPIDPDWRIDRILSAIEKRSVGRPQRIAVLGTHPFFSGNSFRFEIRRRGLPFSVTDAVLANDEEVRRCLITNDYVITKGGVQYPISGAVGLERLRRFFDAGHFRYEMLPVLITLPDGAAARVFKHLPYHVRVPRGITGPARRERSFAPAGRMLDGRSLIPAGTVFGDRVEFFGAYVYRQWDMWFARCSWHPITRPDVRLNAFLHFLDRNGRILGQGDHDPGGAGGTIQWEAGEIITEATALRDVVTMEGVETIGVGLWEAKSSGERLRASGSSLQVDELQTRVLVPASLASGSPPPGLLTLKGREYVSKPVEFSDSIRLVSCRMARNQEGELIIQYSWHCIGAVLRDYQVFVHITGPDGRIVGQDDHFLFEGALPTSKLIPGEWLVETRKPDFEVEMPAENLDVRLGFQSVIGSSDLLQAACDGCETDWEGARVLLRASRSRPTD